MDTSPPRRRLTIDFDDDDGGDDGMRATELASCLYCAVAFAWIRRKTVDT